MAGLCETWWGPSSIGERISVGGRFEVNEVRCTRSALAGASRMLRKREWSKQASRSHWSKEATVGTSGAARWRLRSATKVAQEPRCGPGAGGVIAEQ